LTELKVREHVSKPNRNEMKWLLCFFVWFEWMIAPVAFAQQPGNCSFFLKGADAFQTSFFCKEATWVDGVQPWQVLPYDDTLTANLQHWTDSDDVESLMYDSEPLLLQCLSQTGSISEAKPIWLALTFMNARDPNPSRRIMRMCIVEQHSRHLIAEGFSE
jgi:hypothetical protein